MRSPRSAAGPSWLTTATRRRTCRFPSPLPPGISGGSATSYGASPSTASSIPKEDGLDEEEGLIATGLGQDGPIEIPLAEVEIERKAHNHRLVSDYAYWFHNWL